MKLALLGVDVSTRIRNPIHLNRRQTDRKITEMGR